MLTESMALSLLIFRNHTALLAGLLIAIGAMFFGVAVPNKLGFLDWWLIFPLAVVSWGLLAPSIPLQTGFVSCVRLAMAYSCFGRLSAVLYCCGV